MNSLEKVSILIVSWNGRRHLEQCLPALESQHDPGVEVETLVLDNGSTDGTEAWLRARHPNVRLVVSESNLGFCGGNNRLVREASGDAVILLNNDTKPQADWLAALVDALRSAPVDVAAVSGMIVDWSGERLDFAGGVMTFDGHGFQRGFGQLLEGVEIPPNQSELFFACGGNMIIWKDRFVEAGGFDEAYFSYLEDVDLGWRLWQMGARVVFSRDAVVHHRSMATSDLLGSSNRGFLFERNALLNVFKNYDSEFFRDLLPAVMLTANHRAQTMLVENNPGGFHLGLDPFSGFVANTATDGNHHPSSEENIESRPDRLGFVAKVKSTYREQGIREVIRRTATKTARKLLPDWMFEQASAFDVRVTDDRTVAQLRAIGQLSANLEAGFEQRRVIQARRRRSDAEIFERFPLFVVPTYPGDQRLFESAAFAALLDNRSCRDRVKHLELRDVVS